MLFTPYPDPVTWMLQTCQTRQHSSNLQSNFGEPVWIVADGSGTHWFYSEYCAFRYAPLHTLVVMTGYVSYCCLPIVSKQSSVTSDLNKALVAHYFFLFFRHFPANPSGGCVEKISVDQHFLNALASTTVWHSESLQSPFFLSNILKSFCRSSLFYA